MRHVLIGEECGTLSCDTNTLGSVMSTYEYEYAWFVSFHIVMYMVVWMVTLCSGTNILIAQATQLNHTTINLFLDPLSFIVSLIIHFDT
jgi:hypothetical protein